MKSSITKIKISQLKALLNRMEQVENRVLGIKNKVEELDQTKTKKTY
jgi:hypothetical protein